MPRQPGGTPVAGSQPNSGASADTLQVSKCYTNATATSGGQMLIQARSSDPAARLFAYRPDGTAIGEVQNGGGSRYGGTVIAYEARDPVTVTIRSSSGGTATVATGAYPPGD